MILDKFNLKDKVALITGAAGLLGIEHASALLETGATVILTDISEQKLQDTKKKLSNYYDEVKQNIILYVMDVADLRSIHGVSAQLKKNDIRVDILINNAAIDPKVNNKIESLANSRLENFSLSEWNKQLSVGLTGTFLTIQVFGTMMSSDGKGGVILNIASDLSVIAPGQKLYENKLLPKNKQPVKPITYSAIKFGLIGLTKYVSTYWASDGVRCNALSPGGVYNEQNKDFVTKLSSLIPLGRMAQPNEYRSAVQFLCSDASSYMNGHNLVIDGGRSVL